jgi:Tfp pilus assembly protein PilE
MLLLTRRGESLVELIVALVVLELAGTMALAAALTIERSGRRAAAGAAEDRSRWERYRAVEVAPACAGSTAPLAVPLDLPSTPERPALSTTVRCGP